MTTKENKSNNDALEMLNRLRQQMTEYSTSARQVGDFSKPASGQLHHLKNDYGMPEAFVLITDVAESSCSVIPGSFDAMKGGPNDLVLPKSVLGDYVILAMDLASSLPMHAIGKGFAELDTKSYQRILRSLDLFNGKAVNGETYQYALPYIGKGDKRISYHKKLAKTIDEAKKYSLAQNLVFQPQNMAAKLQTMVSQSQNWVSLWQHKDEFMAVAGSEENDIRKEFKVKGTEIVVQIEYSRPDKKVLVNVFDDKGDYSTQLDGCHIHGADNATLGVVNDGYVEFAYPDDVDECRLCFTKEDGTELKLKALQ